MKNTSHVAALILFLLVRAGRKTHLVCDALTPSEHTVVNRREWFRVTGASSLGISVATTIFTPQDLVANAAESDSVAPIAILGASGRTGALCVTACLQRGIPVRVLTRDGTWPSTSAQPGLSEASLALVEQSKDTLLTVAPCDVKDPDAIRQAVQGCRAVVYAASASKNGGDAIAIDNIGVVQAAQACLENQVDRYIILSSTATTRPNSLGYKFTNILVGGIMDEKRKGEVGVQELYQQANPDKSSFTIIRPGGLNEPKENIVLGPSALEISQGDTLAGIVSRADLAEVSIELALRRNAPNLKNTAVELYYTDSVQACERRFKDFVNNGEAPRLHGQTYDELFSGIQPYIDYYV